MDVSLRLINCIPHGRWNAYEVAAICKEVQRGLEKPKGMSSDMLI